MDQTNGAPQDHDAAAETVAAIAQAQAMSAGNDMLIVSLSSIITNPLQMKSRFTIVKFVSGVCRLRRGKDCSARIAKSVLTSHA